MGKILRIVSFSAVLAASLYLADPPVLSGASDVTYSNVLTLGSTPHLPPQPSNISCSGGSFCLVLSYTEAVAFTPLGQSVFPPSPVSRNGQVVTCFAAMSCFVFWGNRYVAFQNGTWGQIQYIDPNITTFFGALKASCSSFVDCTVLGLDGIDHDYGVISMTNGVWGTWLSTSLLSQNSYPANDLTCTSAGNCIVVGGCEILQQVGGSWSIAPNNVCLDSGSIYAVTCTSAGNCIGVGEINPLDVIGDWRPAVIKEVAGVWGDMEQIPNLAPWGTGWYLTGVACSNSLNCLAIGHSSVQNFLVSEIEGTWSSIAEIQLALLGDMLNSVSVSTTDTYAFCTSAGEVYMPNLPYSGNLLISGNLTVGNTLSAQLAPEPPSGANESFEWLAGNQVITPTGSNTLTISSTYLGESISAAAVISKFGYAPLNENSSAETIAPGVISDLPNPSILGNAKPGNTVTANTGTWPIGVSLSCTWLLNGVVDSSQTTCSYLLNNKSVGETLQVEVIGTKYGYLDATASSLPLVIPPIIPTVPRAFHSSRVRGQLTLLWSPPAFNGGVSLSGYVLKFVYATGKLSGKSVLVLRTGSTSLKIVNRVFRKGSPYCARIVATNSMGSSPDSNRLCFTY